MAKKAIYRFSLFDESKLSEVWHVRIRKSRCILFIVCVIVFFAILLPYLFLRIPIVRNFIFTENPDVVSTDLRHQKERVDSLMFDVLVQKQYLNAIHAILANDISIDSLQSFDSLKLMLQNKIISEKDCTTAHFMQEYEVKQNENMQRVGILPDPSIPSFFAPAHGKITPYKKDNVYGVNIISSANANVYSVLHGTIINLIKQDNLFYELTILHENYISIYRNLNDVIPKNGDVVHTGEILGFTDDKLPLQYELWQNGKNVKPEDIIVF